MTQARFLGASIARLRVSDENSSNGIHKLITPILTFPHREGRDFWVPLTLTLSRGERGHLPWERILIQGLIAAV